MIKKDLKNWHGILKIDEFLIHNQKNEIVYKEENIYNILHQEGELLILNTMFLQSTPLSSFYIGLDNRTTLGFENTLSDINGEPSSNGYARQKILSSEFTISLTSGSNYQVTGPIVNFVATLGSWGPVQNLFLTTVSNGTGGILISSARLSESVTLNPPDIVSMKFSFALSNC